MGDIAPVAVGCSRRIGAREQGAVRKIAQRRRGNRDRQRRDQRRHSGARRAAPEIEPKSTLSGIEGAKRVIVEPAKRIDFDALGCRLARRPERRAIHGRRAWALRSGKRFRSGLLGGLRFCCQALFCNLGRRLEREALDWAALCEPLCRGASAIADQ